MSALTNVSTNHAHHALRAAVLSALPTLSWRHHGIGVLQAYLVEHVEPEVRVHIWHPALLKTGMDASGDVHDHRFSMYSHVLVGTVAHEEWLTTPKADGPYTTMLLTHARAAADSAYHGPTMPTGERFDATVNLMFIEAGSIYSYPARCFHRSPVIGLAVTVVEKHHQRSEAARLLHPVHIPPVMAFGHEIGHSLVAEIIAEARAALGGNKQNQGVKP